MLALAGYNRAVGLRPSWTASPRIEPALIERVLGSERLTIYPDGRADAKAARIDVRVLVLMLYMAHRHGTVTVSSGQTGHGFFTETGNVSNHSCGARGLSFSMSDHADHTHVGF